MEILMGILTVSDKGARGERVDESGRMIKDIAERKLGAKVKRYEIVPDEREEIVNRLRQMVDEGLNLILTTGGTGLSRRDVTPEATREVIEKEIPGIEELIRIKGTEATPHAILSRGIAGVAKESLIINLPGSPRAVRESLELILPALPHALEIISGLGGECGRL